MLKGKLKKYMLSDNEVFNLALDVQKKKASGCRKSDMKRFPLEYPSNIMVGLLENSFKKQNKDCKTLMFSTIILDISAETIVTTIFYINQNNEQVKTILNF